MEHEVAGGFSVRVRVSVGWRQSGARGGKWFSVRVRASVDGSGVEHEVASGSR